MNISFRFSLTAFALVLAACESPTATNAARIANRQAEESGSPFRWRTRSVDGGTVMTRVMVDLPSGPSRADERLKKDVLALIAKAEASGGRSDPQIEAIKPLKDGSEVWVLKSMQEGIAYIVAFKASPKGGTDIEMSGVQKYEKLPK